MRGFPGMHTEADVEYTYFLCYQVFPNGGSPILHDTTVKTTDRVVDDASLNKLRTTLATKVAVDPNAITIVTLSLLNEETLSRHLAA